MIESSFEASHEQEQLQTEKWLNFCGNHVGKMITLLALSNVKKPLSQTQLHRAIGDTTQSEVPYAVGTVAEWANTLCNTGGVDRASAHAVVSGKIQDVKGHVITEEGVSFGLPFSALILDWQARHPDIKIENLIGSSSTRQQGIHAPTLRMLILAETISMQHEKTGPSIGSLASYYESSYNAKQGAVQALENLGILNLDSRQRKNDRQFEIVKATYEPAHPRAKSFEGLKPQTQLAYKTLELAASMKNTWGVDEFMELVAELNTDSLIDLNKIRLAIQQGLAPSKKAFAGYIEPIDDAVVGHGSSIKIEPKHLSAVEELIRIIDGMAGRDPQVLATGKELANSLEHDPDTLMILQTRAYDSSSFVEGNASAREVHIVKLVQENPDLTSYEITKLYRDRYHNNLGVQAVRQSIRDSEDLVREKAPKHLYKKIKKSIVTATT